MLGCPDPKGSKVQGHSIVAHTNDETARGVAQSLKTKSRICKEHSKGFQMPLHYPRYTKADYEKMEEWKVDVLLAQYGIRYEGTLNEKRAFAIGTFLWPDQV